MKEKNKWIPYRELELQDEENNMFSIDTRDFHAGYTLKEKHPDWSTIKKYQKRFFHTEEEIRKLLDRYYEESGGEREWRFLSLKGFGEDWRMKYLRIWRTELGFIVCDSYYKAISKENLSLPVNKEYLF